MASKCRNMQLLHITRYINTYCYVSLRTVTYAEIDLKKTEHDATTHSELIQKVHTKIICYHFIQNWILKKCSKWDPPCLVHNSYPPVIPFYKMTGVNSVMAFSLTQESCIVT